RGGQGGDGSAGPTPAGFHLFSDSPGAGGAGEGGGIAVPGGSLDLSSSLVAYNTAEGGAGGGGLTRTGGLNDMISMTPGTGGAALGGGLYVSAGLLSVADSIAANNTAQGGAGGTNEDKPGSGSTGPAGNAGGGGIEHDGGTLYLIDATVAY